MVYANIKVTLRFCNNWYVLRLDKCQKKGGKCQKVVMWLSYNVLYLSDTNLNKL